QVVARKAGESAAAAKEAVRNPAPEWTAKDLKGQPVKLSDYRGKVVFLDFWATWCPPCVESIPDLISLQQTYGKDGFQIIGMSVDEDVPTIEKWAARNKVKFNYQIVMAEREIIEAYEVEGFPTAFLIDREGKIAKTYRGLAEKEVIANAIKPLLVEKVQTTNAPAQTTPAK
ncbi:MAG: TlpA family protein disulfide reductase, partial [Verrucomicrobiales bacterium]